MNVGCFGGLFFENFENVYMLIFCSFPFHSFFPFAFRLLPPRRPPKAAKKAAAPKKAKAAPKAKKAAASPAKAAPAAASPAKAPAASPKKAAAPKGAAKVCICSRLVGFLL